MGMTSETLSWERVITEDFSQPKDPVTAASSTGLMSHRLTVLRWTAADKGQRTRMFLMKAKIQCKLETGMFKFLFSLRHARNGSSRNNSCHRNRNPLSRSSHWWQMNASQRLDSNMYQGKIPSLFQNSPGTLVLQLWGTLGCLSCSILSPQYSLPFLHTLQNKLQVLLKWKKEGAFKPRPSPTSTPEKVNF